jgi:ring-1,2-phenylacetyl-CoA epoxidase subunit PaaE
MSSFLNSSIKVGDSIKVSEPRGRFIIQDNFNCIIAIAAGSGITPIMSMLKQVLFNTDKSFYLVYSNKSQETTMFLSQIKVLKKQFQSRFFVKFVFTSKDVASHHFGRITGTNIFDMLKFPENKFKLLQSSIYVCGPEKMIDNISLALEKGGLLKENISYELFSSSKKDNLVSSESGDVLITFTVDDFTSKVKSSKKKTVLDCALENDIDAPYSCNGGVCGSCIGRLTKGKVKMLNNTVLTESEIEDGLILACQALAVSDELDIDFDDV